MGLLYLHFLHVSSIQCTYVSSNLSRFVPSYPSTSLPSNTFMSFPSYPGMSLPSNARMSLSSYPGMSLDPIYAYLFHPIQVCLLIQCIMSLPSNASCLFHPIHANSLLQYTVLRILDARINQYMNGGIAPLITNRCTRCS